MAVLSLFPLGIVVNPLLFLFLILPIGLSVYFTVALKEVKDYLNQLKSQIEEVEKKEGEVKEKIKNLEDEMTHILNKYNCLNKADFRKMINEFSKEASLLKDNDLLLKQLMSQKESLENEIGKYQSKIKKYFSLACIDGPIVFENVRLVKERYNKYLELRKTAIVIEDEIKEINKEIEEVKLKIERYQTETKSIFSRNNVKDIAEYEEAIYKKKRYDELVKSLTNNTNLLNSLLGDNNIEYLKKVGDRFNNEHIDSVKGLDVGTLEKELKEISSLIIDKSKEATRIEEKIRNLSSITRSLVSIEEDIIRKNRIKDKYEKKLDALELAIATIEKISKNIQRDFAPKLNKKVGNIISSITDGKYTEVKITENIDIKIIEPKNQRLIGIEELSGGTIDQMYFATRFGIIDIIKGDKNVPIILDDCFIQYDKKRLENILCFLKEEGAKRQIILFTCHTREREIFDKINIKYNYMEL